MAWDWGEGGVCDLILREAQRLVGFCAQGLMGFCSLALEQAQALVGFQALVLGSSQGQSIFFLGPFHSTFPP